MLRINRQHVQVAEYKEQEKQEIVTSKNFEVTLFPCDFSKFTINMKVLSRIVIYLNIQFKSYYKNHQSVYGVADK